jgi:hypothetical protein
MPFGAQRVLSASLQLKPGIIPEAVGANNRSHKTSFLITIGIAIPEILKRFRY